VQQFHTGDEFYTGSYAESSVSGRTPGDAVDFFSSLGTEKKRKPQPDKPDPDKVFHTLGLSLRFTDLVRCSQK
jgi:hypothetical protein